jgi:hypothetical protein
LYSVGTIYERFEALNSAQWAFIDLPIDGITMNLKGFIDEFN